MIRAAIFTKDRACQLEALLKSLKANCPQLFTPYIIYKTSNEAFAHGYNLLMAEAAHFYGPIEWVPQSDDLKVDFLGVCDEVEYVTLFTDDCIWFRKVDVEPWQINNLFKNDRNIVTLSFRLGDNTIIQNYATGQLQPPLSTYNPREYSFAGGEKLNVWRYNLGNSQLNYCYPFSYDGHCYEASTLRQIIREFQTLPDLRSWEGALSHPKNRASISQSKMAALAKSCVVNVPVNGVQYPAIPLPAKNQISAEELNARYLAGEVIDWQSMDYSNVVGCHQEIPLCFTTKTRN